MGFHAKSIEKYNEAEKIIEAENVSVRDALSRVGKSTSQSNFYKWRTDGRPQAGSKIDEKPKIKRIGHDEAVQRYEKLRALIKGGQKVKDAIAEVGLRSPTAYYAWAKKQPKKTVSRVKIKRPYKRKPFSTIIQAAPEVEAPPPAVFEKPTSGRIIALVGDANEVQQILRGIQQW